MRTIFGLIETTKFLSHLKSFQFLSHRIYLYEITCHHPWMNYQCNMMDWSCWYRRNLWILANFSLISLIY